MSATGFASLGLAEPLLRALDAAGYREPTPIQSDAIPAALAGRDLLGCAQTGTGKTAAFALPILQQLLNSAPRARGERRAIRALVLSPTRELASQIAENVAQYAGYTALRAAVVVGGVNQNRQVAALRGGVDVLVATPGRLIDLLNQGLVELNSVETLVLDEADRMLDMGFIPDVRRILRQLPARRQTLFFSATMPDEMHRLAASILRNPVQVRVAPVKTAAELIDQSVYHVATRHKPQLLQHLLMNLPVARAIVFTRTKRGADRVARHLTKARIRAQAIHGNKSQAAREQTLANFKSARPPILVATDIAARGIDVDGVSHVFIYDLPEQPETYVHRIGRTGRAGASGTAIAFCSADEREGLKAIQRLIRQDLRIVQDQPEYIEKEPPVPAKQPGAKPPRTRQQAASSPQKSKAPAQGRRTVTDRPHGERGKSSGGAARPAWQKPKRKRRRRTSAATAR